MTTRRDSDIDTFEGIVDRYSDRLFRFAFMRVGVRETAEDIVQDVLLHLFRSLTDFREIKNPEVFLLRCVSNACIDQITEADFVKSVTVDNKRFRFETELTTMKVGRLRAVMPDGKLSAAWVNIYFFPGFTVGLSIQNGAFDIDNDSEYEFMVNAWLNKDSLAVLIESMGLNVYSGNSTENQETKPAIKYYSDMLLKLEQEINYLNSNVRNSGPLIMKNLERMDSINTKMKSIIDRYADSIKY